MRRSAKKDSSFDSGRRLFWKQILGQAAVAYDESRGIEHMSLAKLGEAPDSVLAEIVPVFWENGGYRVRKGGLYATDQETGRSNCVFQAEGLQIQAIERFGTGMTLTEIAEVLARENKRPLAEAFVLVRELFVTLVKSMYCHPA